MAAHAIFFVVLIISSLNAILGSACVFGMKRAVDKRRDF